MILLAVALLLYGSFHNLTHLKIFRSFPHNAIYYNYLHFYSAVSKYTTGNLICVIIRNHIIDAMWFCSFCLIYFSITNSWIKYVLAGLLAFTSEILQLIFPSTGTFDFIDLLIYVLILAVFFICERCCKSI